MPSDVVLAYLHPVDVGHNFAQSLIETTIYDGGNDRRIGSYIAMRTSSSGVVEGRNKVARQFLDESDGEWLWWVDSDMGWPPSALYELLHAADPDERPVVGALCFAWKEMEVDGMHGYRCVARPTIFDYVDIEGGKKFAGRTTYPTNTLTRCAATGSAMIVIHRSVLETIRAEFGDVWYDRIPAPDGQLGEDISFCARVGAIGKTVHVHTGVPTNHLKTVWVSGVDFPNGAGDD